MSGSQLVPYMCQFATSAMLREDSVLFSQGDAVVDLIRASDAASPFCRDSDYPCTDRFVVSGGVVAPELQRVLGTHVLAIAIQTQHVERYVGVGNLAAYAYGGANLTQEMFSALACVRENMILPTARAAYEEYKASTLAAARKTAAATTRAKWDRRQMRPRPCSAAKRYNKEMIRAYVCGVFMFSVACDFGA